MSYSYANVFLSTPKISHSSMAHYPPVLFDLCCKSTCSWSSPPCKSQTWSGTVLLTPYLSNFCLVDNISSGLWNFLKYLSLVKVHSVHLTYFLSLATGVRIPNLSVSIFPYKSRFNPNLLESSIQLPSACISNIKPSAKPSDKPTAKVSAKPSA